MPFLVTFIHQTRWKELANFQQVGDSPHPPSRENPDLIRCPSIEKWKPPSEKWFLENPNFENCYQYVFQFLMLYLAASWPTLGHYQEKCLTHQILITSFLSIFKGYCEPCNEPLLVNQVMLSPCIDSSPTPTKFLRATFGKATP